jgi:integrase
MSQFANFSLRASCVNRKHRPRDGRLRSQPERKAGASYLSRTRVPRTRGMARVFGGLGRSRDRSGSRRASAAVGVAAGSVTRAEGPELRFHDLRRTFTGLLFTKGSMGCSRRGSSDPPPHNLTLVGHAHLLHADERAPQASARTIFVVGLRRPGSMNSRSSWPRLRTTSDDRRPLRGSVLRRRRGLAA